MKSTRPSCVFLSWRNELLYCHKRQIPIKATLCRVCLLHKSKIEPSSKAENTKKIEGG